MKRSHILPLISFLCLLTAPMFTPKVMGWSSVEPFFNLHKKMTIDALQSVGWSNQDISEIAEYASYEGHIIDFYHRVSYYQSILHTYHVPPHDEECKCFEQGKYGGAEDGAYYYIQMAQLNYAMGNIAEAKKFLGYTIHFIQDAVCPPHVFPFSEKTKDTAHWHFEFYTADEYGKIMNNWPHRVITAEVVPIESAEDLRQKIIDAAKDVEKNFPPPRCSYVRQDGVIIGDLSGTIWGWKMSDDDIGWCMAKAASLVKGTAIYVRRARNLDLIFAIDVTGSMWDDIAEVKASASQIVEAIASKVTGYRIAVVSYRDFPVYPYGNPGDWPYKDVLSFSTQKTEIIAAIQSLVVGGGADWEESVYSALMHCIDASTLGGWRTGANKFIILMGDAPPHDPEPFTGYTLNDVINAAEEADPVAIYPIVIGPDPNTYTYFSNLAEGTNGKVFTAATASEVPDTIIEAIEVIIDTEPPSINIEVPQPGDALQDGVTLKATVSDPSGVEWVTFSIREPNGELGNIIDPLYESMPATHIGDDTWQLLFDTTQLPDGYYILLVNASDTLGNEGYATVAFSIRNWAVLELLPATPNNKAGRTMPIKFALRVAASVDPNQPFIYNEELTIKIYATDDPSNILQISTFGDKARDYRINTVAEHYITNFQTLKIPKTYTVEIWRKNMLIGSFSFQTVK